MILAALSQAPTGEPGQAELPPIRDIAPPLDVFPWPAWMIASAVFAALVVLAIAGILIVKAVRNRPKPPPPTPRAIALQELQNLHAKVGQLGPYEFSIAVSDVLRTYIGREWGLHAREQTSPEFLAAISGSMKFSRANKELLAQFLERCDLIKFARIDATEEDSTQLLSSAIAFVQGDRA